jgi:hypothetical protein
MQKPGFASIAAPLLRMVVIASNTINFTLNRVAIISVAYMVAYRGKKVDQEDPRKCYENLFPYRPITRPPAHDAARRAS